MSLGCPFSHLFPFSFKIVTLTFCSVLSDILIKFVQNRHFIVFLTFPKTRVLDDHLQIFTYNSCLAELDFFV